MPVTKSAKRALRGSAKKESVNKIIVSRLEIAVRAAKKTGSKDKILEAVSFADRAVKKRTIHKNKAARIKSQMAKLLGTEKVTKKASKTKKTSAKK